MNFMLSLSEIRPALYGVCCVLGIFASYAWMQSLYRALAVPGLAGNEVWGIIFRVVIGIAAFGFYLYLCVELPNVKKTEGVYLGTSDHGAIYLYPSPKAGEGTLETVKGERANRTLRPVGKVRTFMRRISDGAAIVGKPFQYPLLAGFIAYLFLSLITYVVFLLFMLANQAEKHGAFEDFGQLAKFASTIRQLNSPTLILGGMMLLLMLVSISIQSLRSVGVDKNLSVSMTDAVLFQPGETVQGKIIALKSFLKDRRFRAVYYKSSSASDDFLGDPIESISINRMDRLLTEMNYWVIEIAPKASLKYPLYVSILLPIELKPEALRELQTAADHQETRTFKIEDDLSLSPI